MDIEGDDDFERSGDVTFEAGLMLDLGPKLLVALRDLRAAIGGLPITILNGPFYDALARADAVLPKAPGDGR